MQNLEQRNNLINQIVDKVKSAGVAHLTTEDDSFSGREITVRGNRMVNFASCSYLGLANDERLTQMATDYAKRFGHSFPTSRSYVSMGILEELEETLEKVFGYPTLVTTSTSLGHVAWMPLLISAEDAVILDHQVHNSVSTAAQMAKAQGAHLEVVRHNRIDLLEERILDLKDSHRKIWYLIDGIYSMYGDTAPIQEIHALMDRYPQLHVYADDAHGMSWIGQRGAGYVLSEAPLHPRMALITSLGKGFGSLGGALIFPDVEQKTLVRNCGGPLIFSSPMTPATIGASMASAQLHLQDDFAQLQQSLQDRMAFFRKTAMEFGIPLIDQGNTPIFFIPVGTPDNAFEIARRLMAQGYYQSLSVFPSVPVNNSGLRFTLTNWIEYEDITAILRLVARERKQVLAEFDYSEKKIQRAFRNIRVAWPSQEGLAVGTV
jgi:7-keto-8-aminopelargonate synthetase-like enzyme